MADTAKATATAMPQTLQRDLRSKLLGDYGVLLVVLAMGVALSILQPDYFLSAQNLT
ncbi:MAG: hypothetical protein JO273_15000, partial [Methylobacteriaceae bacterium]|nr:hypothetical protein [Methylobacteriaceae bacterium]